MTRALLLTTLLAACAGADPVPARPGDIDLAGPATDGGGPLELAFRLRYRLAELPLEGGLDEPAWKERVPHAVGVAPVTWDGCAGAAPAGCAAASLLEPEPGHAVRLGGATIEVAEIKARLQAAYERSDGVALGGRCHGRLLEAGVLDPACPGVDPAALHVVVATFVGLGDAPLIVDDAPITGYRMTVDRRTGEVELVTDAGDRFHYVLDVDAGGKIGGGRWLDDSPRPGLLWTPLRASGPLDEARLLLGLSLAGEVSGGGG
jgi:hypothetical protein